MQLTQHTNSGIRISIRKEERYWIISTYNDFLSYSLDFNIQLNVTCMSQHLPQSAEITIESLEKLCNLGKQLILLN